jgi:hypothetical protein
VPGQRDHEEPDLLACEDALEAWVSRFSVMTALISSTFIRFSVLAA